MSIDDFVDTLNEFGGHGVPFFCLIDFEMQKPVVIRLSEIRSDEVRYDFNGKANFPRKITSLNDLKLVKHPVDIKAYQRKYQQVHNALEYGDTYLANLTIKTPIECSLTLEELFNASEAKYKLWYRNEFMAFSPEIFVQIADGRICAYPMKGTIDASIAGAREKILADNKETAEHVTIVDLIRNDLSLVAKNVRVSRFRYIDELQTNNKNLLQVSSEITGDLPLGHQGQIGTILVSLLPAGSVSGAPKRKTVAMIRKAEEEPRGYYTGIAGIFDGKDFDSGVMIRFIEQQDGKMFYRSGGGITSHSIMEMEYNEAIDKIYVPVN